MAPSRMLLLAFAASVLAPAAAAAPVSRPAELRLTLHTGFLLLQPGNFDCYPCDGPVLSATATVGVDDAAGTLRLGSGLLTLATPWVASEAGSTTGIAGLSVSRMTLFGGTLSVAGAAGIPGEPACPQTGTAACVAQSGFGGDLRLAVAVGVVVVPGQVTIPLSATAAGLGGPPVPTPLGLQGDFAPWTVRTGRMVQTPLSTARSGSIAASRFSLVTPVLFVPVVGNTQPMFGELEIAFTDGLGVPGFVSGVPEPAGLVLLTLGLAGLLALRRS